MRGRQLPLFRELATGVRVTEFCGNQNQQRRPIHSRLNMHVALYGSSISLSHYVQYRVVVFVKLQCAASNQRSVYLFAGHVYTRIRSSLPHVRSGAVRCGVFVRYCSTRSCVHEKINPTVRTDMCQCGCRHFMQPGCDSISPLLSVDRPNRRVDST